MPGLRSSLRAHEVELGALGLERHRRIAVEARRVRHVRIEDQLVELVGEVVVVADGGEVALAAVQVAGQAGLGGRRDGTATDQAVPRGQTDGSGHVTRTDARTAGLRVRRARLAHGGPHGAEPGSEITLDVEVSLHVGAGDAQLARLPQHVADGPACRG